MVSDLQQIRQRAIAIASASAQCIFMHQLYAIYILYSPYMLYMLCQSADPTHWPTLGQSKWWWWGHMRVFQHALPRNTPTIYIYIWYMYYTMFGIYQYTIRSSLDFSLTISIALTCPARARFGEISFTALSQLWIPNDLYRILNILTEWMVYSITRI